MDVVFVISNSSDAVLEDYCYSEGRLTLTLCLTEIEQRCKLVINTDCFVGSKYCFEKKDGLYRTCRIELVELKSTLSSQNGFFVPSPTFGEFMKEARVNYNLAYGRKTTEVKYIFSLVGYDVLVSCLLKDANDIVVYEGGE